MKVNKLIQSIMVSALIGLFSTSVMAGEYPVYEGFNTEAKALQPYSGQPGKGKTIAFANIVNGSPFCDLVEASIIRQAKLAGFTEDNIIILNNQYNAVIGLKNADIILAQEPDVFIEFQFDTIQINDQKRRVATLSGFGEFAPSSRVKILVNFDHSHSNKPLVKIKKRKGVFRKEA